MKAVSFFLIVGQRPAKSKCTPKKKVLDGSGRVLVSRLDFRIFSSVSFPVK